jgi:regulator of sigma E protease
VDFLTTLLGMGGTAWTLVFFVIALSIIVFVHEYGHYIVGRWSGIHAEVFSLGFGPVLASRTDKRGTRWQIAADALRRLRQVSGRCRCGLGIACCATGPKPR